MKKSSFPSNLNVLILGCSGLVGSLMINILSTMKFRSITGLDRIECENQNLTRFIKHDISKTLDLEKEYDFDTYDIIIFAIPFDSFKNFFNQIHKQLKIKVILVDLFSIKSDYIKFINKNEQKLSRKFSLISINPLYRPTSEISEGKFLIFTKHPNSLSDSFINELKNIIPLIFLEHADEHDKLMSIIQVAPHFAIISLAIFLRKSGLSLDILKSNSTHFMEGILCLISRICAGSPHVYYEIQSKNAYADETRELLSQAGKELIAFLDDGKIENFKNEFEMLQDYFKELKTYHKKFSRIIKK